MDTSRLEHMWPVHTTTKALVAGQSKGSWVLATAPAGQLKDVGVPEGSFWMTTRL